MLNGTIVGDGWISFWLLQVISLEKTLRFYVTEEGMDDVNNQTATYYTVSRPSVFCI